MRCTGNMLTSNKFLCCDAVEMLNKRPDLAKAVDREHNTLLHMAALSGNVTAMEVLRSAEIDVNAVNKCVRAHPRCRERTAYLTWIVVWETQLCTMPCGVRGRIARSCCWT